VKQVEVHLLAHKLSYRSFTYTVPSWLPVQTGEVVAAPFRRRIETGIVSGAAKEIPEAPPLPLLGRLQTPGRSPCEFGHLLLTLAHYALATPGELFGEVAFGKPERRISLLLTWRGDARPQKHLEEAYSVLRLLAPRDRNRITQTLSKKLFQAITLDQLTELIVGGLVAIEGEVALAPSALGAAPARAIRRRQQLLFTGRDGGVPLPPDSFLFQNARDYVGLLTRQKTAPERLNLGVRRMDWRKAVDGTLARELCGSLRRLLILPSEAFMRRFFGRLPAAISARVFRFDPDASAETFRELARRLQQDERLLVVGKRAAQFLLPYAPFDEVVLFDPTNESLRSEQFPRYDTKVDLYLMSLLTGVRLTFIPLTPCPPFAADPVPVPQVETLPSSAGERIDAVTEYVSRHACCGRRVLVYNNALGSGQVITCTFCCEELHCPRCGQHLAHSHEEHRYSCSRCGFSEPAMACGSCGGREFAVRVIGVEGLARRVRRTLRGLKRKCTPRVGALYDARRRRIREANLGRTDVLIGTSTLFQPLAFYRPEEIVLVAQEHTRAGRTGVPEESVLWELSRLAELYGASETKLTVLAAPAMATSLAARTGSSRAQTLAEEAALRAEFQLPPYNPLIEFFAYSSQDSRLRRFVQEMMGQLEYAQRVLLAEHGPVRRTHGEERFLMRGRLLLASPSYSLLRGLRIRGKRQKIDLVYAAHYFMP